MEIKVLRPLRLPGSTSTPGWLTHTLGIQTYPNSFAP